MQRTRHPLQPFPIRPPFNNGLLSYLSHVKNGFRFALSLFIFSDSDSLRNLIKQCGCELSERLLVEFFKDFILKGPCEAKLCWSATGMMAPSSNGAIL